jgi:two-component sensor histidine kinase
MQRVFRDDGHDVDHAADAAAGLARIQRGDVAAVILALDRDNASSLEFLYEINGLPAPPPVVYVTATTELEVATKALKAGASGFVVRTAGRDFEVQLLAALQLSLDQAKLQREKERVHSKVREARDRAMALLEEVNHRVANSLALVVSLVRMQAATTPDANAKTVLAETQARIAAVANLHRTLYASETVLAVDLATYLQALVDELRQSIAAETHTVMLSVRADSARISTDKAVAIGMIVTELITNAIKYAYPGGSGEVRLLLERDSGGFMLTIEDDGVGFAGEFDKSAGLGGRIVGAMARSIGTELTYESPAFGARATLRLSPELFSDPESA